MRPRIADIAAAVDGACQTIGARWYLFGAQAAIARGVVRFTEDVDITVDLGDSSTTALIHALAQRGVTMRVPDADEFIAATRVLPLRHDASGVPVDVVLAGSGLEDAFFGRLSIEVVDGVEIPIPALEDLVVMKVIAGRPKDVEDVVALLVANPNCDTSRIETDLGELEQALAVGDLVPAFGDACSRARRALARRR